MNPPVHPEEPFGGAWWIPAVGEEQPFHGQLMLSDDHRTLGVCLYVPTELQEDNRLTFSDTETDRMGMPKITVTYALSAADRALTAKGKLLQRRVGEALGAFHEESADALPLGGSLHATGTVRLGDDEHTSVANLDGLVWGTRGVYVAGNGAVPTALSCNSTLTAVALAVGTVRAIAARFPVPASSTRLVG
jgi:choline dehydrogenase-like flavoprotein